jgi:tight adherence protein B
VARRLAGLDAAGTAEDDLPDLVKRRTLSGLPWLHALLGRFGPMRRLDRMIAQADLRAPLGVFVTLSLVLALAGYLLGSSGASSRLLAALCALVLGSAPLAWAAVMRSRRLGAFEAQLPDGLDLVSRALKAGHTFTSGMGLVAREFGPPIGPEFGKTLDEINFGLNPNEALGGLADRMDCLDLDFFVVSVNIQSETGGNLAEIVENISLLIRERFKLKGKVRSLSAEGKLAAIILIALPFGVAAFIKLANPGYLDELVGDPLGRMMLYGAAGLMTFGILVIKKMIAIKV